MSHMVLDVLYDRVSLEKLMAKNPTLIGEVSGIKFYEHPIHGDEVGMIAVDETGAYQTDWHDLPTKEDLE